jgi:hypothetical protein
MSPLVECPHCQTRVLPMAGRRCPAWGNNVDSPPPEPTRAQLVKDVYGFAAERMLKGVAPSEIQANLAEQGLDAETAATIVGNLKGAEVKANREAAQKNMLHGALWCIGGLVVTVATYRMASGLGSSRFVIALGAVLFGGVQFVRGLRQMRDE